VRLLTVEFAAAAGYYCTEKTAVFGPLPTLREVIMAPRRILLIDDEGPLRDALARALISEGHNVQVANATEVQGWLSQFAPDTVVYDADSARQAVRDVVPQLRTQPGACLLIALSRGGQPAAGASESASEVVLARPINMEELRRALRDG
jgi:DNA-binding response OmpR family regulator